MKRGPSWSSKQQQRKGKALRGEEEAGGKLGERVGTQPGWLFLAWLCTLRTPECRYVGAHSQPPTWPVTCPHPRCLSKGGRHSCSHRGPGIPRTTPLPALQIQDPIITEALSEEVKSLWDPECLTLMERWQSNLNSPELSDKTLRACEKKGSVCRVEVLTGLPGP